MSNNQNGPSQGAKYTLQQNMRAFDMLPKELRQALANSDYNWSAAQALYQGLRGRKRKYTAAELIEIIERNDKAARRVVDMRHDYCGA
jgi:hypothetical protein